MQHIADNHEALLDYLYEEGDSAERLKIARHLQECAPCSVAVLELQSVRGMLRDWRPPTSDLGFRLVQDTPSAVQAAAHEPSRGWAITPLPRWTQAAAAAVLFAAGMAVSQLHVDYRNGALTVSTQPVSSEAGLQTASRRTASIHLAPELVPAALPSGPSEHASIDSEQLLQRVRAMIDQSEQRQQRLLALRVSQVASEVDAQHQADLLRIQQNIGQQQDDFMNYLVRTSGGPK